MFAVPGYHAMLLLFFFCCRTQMWVMPFLLVNVVLAFITLIVACMLSVGFKDFCDGYEDNDKKVKYVTNLTVLS